ncbi:MAG: class I SAM-dependent methyltransferase [Proteobacteria bacterium]|nr:class I SAM-dependent methyltransferase [Pseudomonadota bacterium]
MSEENSPDKFVPALGFSWLTRIYDPVVRLTTREQRFKSELLAQAGLAAPMEVLDLACGTGTLAIRAKRQHPGCEITGIDADDRILKIARGKAKKEGQAIDFQQGFSTKLPFRDRHFDCVLSSLFFHHLLPDAKQLTFREVHRVLKPGGQLHIADWGKPGSFLMRGLFYFIQLLDGFDNTRDNVQGRLPELMRQAGFRNVTTGREFSTMFGTMTLYSGQK